MCQTKICTKCGEEKAVSEYHKDSNSMFGVRPDCKRCRHKKHVIKSANNKTLSKKDISYLSFFTKAIENHGNWFDWSLTDITIEKEYRAIKRVVICPIHGPFAIDITCLQRNKYGCKHCAPLLNGMSNRVLNQGDKKECPQCKTKGILGVDFRKKYGKRSFEHICKICQDKRRVEIRRTKTLLQNKRTQIAYSKCTHCNDVRIVKQQEDTNHYCEVCNDVFKIKQNRIKVLLELLDRFRECIICGNIFASFQGNTCCSNECKKERKKRRKKVSGWMRKRHKDRAAYYGCYYERFNEKLIFKRDKWKCKACGIKVQKKDHLADNAAELDHIIPLSKGGPHTPSNCQTLCRKCNQYKSDKIEEGTQITLFYAAV